MIRRLRCLSYEERLKVLSVHAGEEKALWRPYCCFSVLEEACRKAGNRNLPRSYCDRTRDYGLKLKEVIFKLDIRNFFFFPMRMVKHGHSLPREMADTSSLETSRARLDRDLSNLI